MSTKLIDVLAENRNQTVKQIKLYINQRNGLEELHVWSWKWVELPKMSQLEIARFSPSRTRMAL